MRTLAACVLAIALGSAPSFAEDFTCYSGRGACLNYGDTVCSSGAKCVADDAVCFDAYTCGYGGFVCKSGMDELASKFDALAVRFNDLLDSSKAVSAEFDDLAEKQRRARDCVASAGSLEEAQGCIF
jgi:hypothetical protein